MGPWHCSKGGSQNEAQRGTVRAVYSLQLVLILGLALPLPRLFGLRNPRSRLTFLHLLLVLILMLPAAGLLPVARQQVGIVSDLQIGAIIVDSTSGPRNSPLIPVIFLILASVALIRLARLFGGLIALKLIYRTSEPVVRDGHPVRFQVTVRVNFALK